jgi:putative transposase
VIAEKNLYLGMKVGRPDSSLAKRAPDLVYLAATIDRATRKVLAHRVSITTTSDFCFNAFWEAIAKNGTPERSAIPTRTASSPATISPAC